MAFIFMDGFDSYNAVAQVSDKWDSSNVASFGATSGRFGGGAIFDGTTGGTHAVTKNINWTVGSSPLNFGFWMKTGTSINMSGSDNGVILNNNSSSGGTWGIIRSGSGGTVLVAATNASSPVLTSGTHTVMDGAWHWVEVSVLMSTTSGGYIKVYLDGILEINYSGITCATSSYLPTIINNIEISPTNLVGGNAIVGYLDDAVVWDGTGSGNWSSFPLGPLRIQTLVPSGDGTPLQFTPSTGTTHYNLVNGGYGDTGYVFDSSTGNTDLYTYPNLGFTPTTIYGVVGNYYAQNPGTGSANLIPKVKTSGTTESGTTTPLSTASYRNIQNLFATDASSNPWTTTSINSMQLGMGD